MRVDLRRALATDAAAIAELARDSLPERWSAQAFLAELDARSGIGFVAVAESGELLGYALAARTHTELEIRSLAVASAHRRRGLGGRLLAALLEAERSQGTSDVVLEVRRSNAAALQLYAAAGFEACGERPGYYADGETAIVMAARL